MVCVCLVCLSVLDHHIEPSTKCATWLTLQLYSGDELYRSYTIKRSPQNLISVHRWAAIVRVACDLENAPTPIIFTKPLLYHCGTTTLLRHNLPASTYYHNIHTHSFINSSSTNGASLSSGFNSVLNFSAISLQVRLSSCLPHPL
jgi:hypothetical protein